MTRAGGKDRLDLRIDAVQRLAPTLGDVELVQDRTNSAGNRSAAGGRGWRPQYGLSGLRLLARGSDRAGLTLPVREEAAPYSHDLRRLLAGMPLALPLPSHLPASFHVFLRQTHLRPLVALLDSIILQRRID